MQRPTAAAEDPRLGERRVDAAVGAEAVAQPGGRAEDAACAAHVLAHHHHVGSRSSSTWKASLIASTMSQLRHRGSSAARPGRRRTRPADRRYACSNTSAGSGGGSASAAAIPSRIRSAASARIDSASSSESTPEPAQVRLVAAEALALLLLLDPLEIDVGARVVGGRVRRGPIRDRLDERRPLARPRPRDRLARRLVDGEHVAAVDAHARGSRSRRPCPRASRRASARRPASRSPSRCCCRRGRAARASPRRSSRPRGTRPPRSRRRRSRRSRRRARRAASCPRRGRPHAARASRSGRRSTRRSSRAGSTSRRDGRATTRGSSRAASRAGARSPTRGSSGRSSPRARARSTDAGLHRLVVPEDRVRADPALAVVDDRALVVGPQQDQRAVEVEQVLLGEPLDLAVRDAFSVADHAPEVALGRKHLGHDARIYRDAELRATPRRPPERRWPPALPRARAPKPPLDRQARGDHHERRHDRPSGAGEQHRDERRAPFPAPPRRARAAPATTRPALPRAEGPGVERRPRVEGAGAPSQARRPARRPSRPTPNASAATPTGREPNRERKDGRRPPSRSSGRGRRPPGRRRRAIARGHRPHRPPGLGARDPGVAPECPHLLERGLQRLALAPLDHGHAEPQVAERSASRRSSQSRWARSSSSWSPGGANGTGEISMTARSKPRARRSSSARTERSSSNGVSASTSALRRQRAHRQQVDALPRVAEEDLGVEQRVEHAVELADPARGGQPVEHAAERDEPDAVLLTHVVDGERGGSVHRVVERALTATARLREGVQEDDDVGVALRVRLVHPGLTAPRSRAPVHAPHPVARDERAQVGELDPFAMRARQLVAGERLRLERAQQLLQRLPRGYTFRGRRRSSVCSKTNRPNGSCARRTSSPTRWAPQRSQRMTY